LYVKAGDNTNAGNGNSWAEAMTDLQAAITAAQTIPNGCDPIKIFVAAGTYTPSSTGDRSKSFVLQNNMRLQGGFAGTETNWADADPTQNKTILSGDLEGNDGTNFANHTENSYNVVRGHSLDASSILAGFTIRGAMNDQAATKGGGMYLAQSSMQISRVIFEENKVESATLYNGGAGLHIVGGSPAIDNTVFHNNVVVTGAGYNGGGGLYVSNSTATFRAMEFTDNEVKASMAGSTYRGGGAVYLYCGGGMVAPCTPTFINAQFLFNRAGDHDHKYSGGGAIYSVKSAFRLVNADFYENEAPGKSKGGAIYQAFDGSGAPQIVNATFMDNVSMGAGDGIYTFSTGEDLTITNSIFLGNEIEGQTGKITYSCMRPGTLGGSTNHTCDFIELDEGLYPPFNSVAHNGGDDSANDEPFDVEGNTRKVGTIDMGAYERQ